MIILQQGHYWLRSTENKPKRTVNLRPSVVKKSSVEWLNAKSKRGSVENGNSCLPGHYLSGYFRCFFQDSVIDGRVVMGCSVPSCMVMQSNASRIQHLISSQD